MSKALYALAYREIYRYVFATEIEQIYCADKMDYNPIIYRLLVDYNQ